MYKRVLLKLSGEALMGKNSFGFHEETMNQICADIFDVYQAGYEVAIVIGGGNICRGNTLSNMHIDRVSADSMGMLATTINALALRSKLENLQIMTRIQNPLSIPAIAEPIIIRKAIRHIEKGRVVIFCSGTGNPFFTTDTAAVLRALETKSDVIVKCTTIDGVFSEDPIINTNAEFYNNVSYDTILSKNIKIMDATAISLARDNKIPIIVCNLYNKGTVLQALNHQGKFSLIQ